MRLTRAQRLKIANFSGHRGSSSLDRVEEELVEKGVLVAREGFMVSLTWGEGWEERAGEIRRELARGIRPLLSEEAVEALLERRFHPEHREHGLGWERAEGRLFRERLGLEVVRIVEEERS